MVVPALALLVPLALPQEPDPHRSELPATLPAALETADGETVADPADWPARRAELLELFEANVYGRTPEAIPVHHEVVDSRDALGGKAVRSRVRVTFGNADEQLVSELLVFRPKNRLDAPLFLGLNFRGNHTVVADPDLPVPAETAKSGKDSTRPAPAKDRGKRARRYPVARLIARGYGFATAWYGDLDPDFDDGFQNGLHPLLESPTETRPTDAPGSIAIWAYGLSAFRRVLEGLGTPQVAVFGHSRLGKTSLWAGAIDTRFALVISNDSGCGGAALSMRAHGETVAVITERFPHWFCKQFSSYGKRESSLPVDQHLLIALCAPRPVYVASATKDDWADPLGEFLAAREAGAVYELLGHRGLETARQPAPDTSVGERIGYHIRTGRHDLTGADWGHFLDFADRHLSR